MGLNKIFSVTLIATFLAFLLPVSLAAQSSNDQSVSFFVQDAVKVKITYTNSMGDIYYRCTTAWILKNGVYKNLDGGSSAPSGWASSHQPCSEVGRSGGSIEYDLSQFNSGQPYTGTVEARISSYCYDSGTGYKCYKWDVGLVTLTTGTTTQCVKSNPAVTITPSFYSGNAGNTFSFTTSVKNNDVNCPARNFDVQASVPSSWTTSFDPIITLSPGETRSLTFTVTSPTWASGTNYVTVTATSEGYQSSATAAISLQQTTAKGTLYVRVFDTATGAGISSARVDAAANVDPTVFTDSNGNAFLNLDPGMYRVTVSAPNYNTMSTTANVISGQATSISFGLIRTATFNCQLSLAESRINNPNVVKGNNLDVFVKLRMTFPTVDPTAEVTVNVERPNVDPSQTKTFVFPFSGATDERTFSFTTWDLQTGTWNVYVNAVGEGNCGTLPRTFIGSANVITSTVVSNTPPVANAGADKTVTQGQSFTLSAGSSFDPDGSIVSYDWREGGVVLSSSVSFSTSLAVGTHYITLTVTDNRGSTAADTVVVTVTSTPRVDPPEFRFANYNIPGQATEGSTVTFSATVVNDGPDPGTSVVRFLVDSSERCASNINLAVGSSTAQTCNWSATAGSHQVTIRVDPAPYESNTANNEVSSTISVSAQQTQQQPPTQQSSPQPSQLQQPSQTIQYQSQPTPQPVFQQTSYPTTTVYQSSSSPISVSTPADISSRVQDISSTSMTTRHVPSISISQASLPSQAIVVQTANYEGFLIVGAVFLGLTVLGIAVLKRNSVFRFQFQSVRSRNPPESFPQDC